MSAPSLLRPGSARDPLVVVRSPFWSFNAIGLFDGDAALVIDPGIYPEDIALLDAAVRTRAGGARAVTYVVVTHSHHDHIRGWQRFPGARVVLPRVAAEKGDTARRRILAAKATIDARLGVEDPGFAYPRADAVFDERAVLRVGALEVQLRFLPGHSDCTSVAWIPALRTLCTADYLVSPGLPYCRWEAHAFEAALTEMRRWVTDEGVERVVPAHDDLIEGHAAVLAAIDLELAYFRHLRADVRARLASGAPEEQVIADAARAIDAWRATDVGRRRVQDTDNARRVVREELARSEAPRDASVGSNAHGSR